MALRCLVFTADEGTAAPICQVLASLGVEGEHCPSGPEAVDKIASHGFQIVIIDWDQQPEAGLLLEAARDRKPNERPLTLAIVGDDGSVPKALQAGANSILRKPIQIHQVTDTLTTARGLLRAKESAQAAAAAAAASSGAAQGAEKILRAGEFLQSSAPAPGAQFVTESDATTPGELPAEPMDPLKELEPVAASVAKAPTAPPPASSDEPRGLEWYLKNRGISRPVPAPAAAAAPAPAPDKPELMGFDQTPSFSGKSAEQPKDPEEQKQQERQTEAKLFAYIDGEEPEKRTGPRFRLGKRMILAAAALAACAIAAAPQAPWHPRMTGLWKRGQQTLHGWLNPQPVITAQAPTAHETFTRPGDEYKLPVVENIPDATTDPSQIQVLPVVDPTAKKPSTPNPADQSPTQPDGGTDGAANPADNSGVQVQQNQATQPGIDAPPGTASSPTTAQPPSPTPTPVQPSAPAQTRTVPVTVPSSLLAPPPADPAGPKAQVSNSGYVATPGGVPSSLKSQMASMTPEASGNKAPEAALPAIEPVAVPEITERGLLTDQPSILYPPTAKGQHGTVVLQVVIGRDGTVQDAKFQQGSLAFARAAIEGVKQWKFKPYILNGRPVSVQTTLTMSFKPGQ